jgi:hypothetical protein
MIERVEKYGEIVWANIEMDELRKKECLCLSDCTNLNKCEKAKNLYEMCKENGMAMMITRCRSYSPRE